MTEQKELNQTETETQTKTFAQGVAEYEPKKTGIISDLEFFNMHEPIVEEVGNKGKDDEFKYLALVREGKSYRIPWGVFEAVQNLQEDRMDKGKEPYTAFQVIKTGTGREHTKYQTIPHIAGV